MNHKTIDELTARLAVQGHEVCRSEQRVIERVAKRLHISRDAGQEFDQSMGFGERVADRIAAFGGSWTFILSFLGLLVVWVVLNAALLTRSAVGPFDPYPFVFLNLILSMLAALQAPVIMMSQNRQSAKDRKAAEHDYEVNLKAELEILGLHQKVDKLREQQWLELVEMQREQIALLTRLLEAKA
ncbi:MAG: DUF1003 domain-containing protein [Nevskia sp.]|nr:DUF1003 domain-containing protein [Nevskia sp.]